MTNFTLRGQVIEARQWDGTAQSLREIADWVNPLSGNKNSGDPLLTWITDYEGSDPRDVMLATCDGHKSVSKDDWIAKLSFNTEQYEVDDLVDEAWDFIVLSDPYFRIIFEERKSAGPMIVLDATSDMSMESARAVAETITDKYRRVSAAHVYHG